MGQLEQFLSDISPNGDWQPLIDYINQNYVSKKSINNKIEELEQCKKEELQNDDEFGTHSIKWAIADYVIETLKELLKNE